ncbi:prophage tail fiber N-terminal domain-containing protein, partial [Escherichia coli]|uniref:prophage tail fiber N-terminal domain-containing protein n=1 Tax=Escherichia coli TaxID=562 RepID=UPI002740E9BD
MGFSSARNLGRDISAGFSPPRRMPISEAVKKFMRVPKGAGNSVPWDPELTPYIIEPMNCLTEDDVMPEALRRFEEMVEEAARNAEAASQSAA